MHYSDKLRHKYKYLYVVYTSLLCTYVLYTQIHYNIEVPNNYQFECNSKNRMTYTF